MPELVDGLAPGDRLLGHDQRLHALLCCRGSRLLQIAHTILLNGHHCDHSRASSFSFHPLLPFWKVHSPEVGTNAASKLVLNIRNPKQVAEEECTSARKCHTVEAAAIAFANPVYICPQLKAAPLQKYLEGM